MGDASIQSDENNKTAKEENESLDKGVITKKDVTTNDNSLHHKKDSDHTKHTDSNSKVGTLTPDDLKRILDIDQ